MKNARRIMLSTFGAVTGLAGIEHGTGEVLQGNSAPVGLMFPSWPDSAFFRSLNGEPAISLIPNLLVTGILTIFFSVLFAAWSIGFIESKRSSLMLITLSIAMLLTGGGVFPPVFGILIGAGASYLHPRPQARRSGTLDKASRITGGLWPWLFGASLISWFAMIPGIPALDYFFGFLNPTLILIVLVCMFGFLFLAWVSAGIRDLGGSSAAGA
ncbi:MAG: hypothetical protein JW748_10135 [Anaerolineales bacterium]|nr:hypothetical protein [Anaerolineales bacterium]